MVVYLAIIAIILAVGIVLCFLASLGHNTHFTYSKEKIEVHSENENSNLDKKDIDEE